MRVERKEFAGMTPEAQRVVLFDNMYRLEEKLDGYKTRISFFSGTGGILGGMIAVAFKWCFFGGD